MNSETLNQSISKLETKRKGYRGRMGRLLNLKGETMADQKFKAVEIRKALIPLDECDSEILELISSLHLIEPCEQRID